MADNRERAASRRRHRLFLADKRRKEAEEIARQAKFAADYAEELERMVELGSRPPQPRIRSL